MALVFQESKRYLTSIVQICHWLINYTYYQSSNVLTSHSWLSAHGTPNHPHLHLDLHLVLSWLFDHLNSLCILKNPKTWRAETEWNIKRRIFGKWYYINKPEEILQEVKTTRRWIQKVHPKRNLQWGSSPSCFTCNGFLAVSNLSTDVIKPHATSW